MEVVVIGVVRMSGIGKESGLPFDFAQLKYLKPVEPVAKEKFQLRGYGNEVAEADVAISSFERFGQLSYPCRIHLEIETVPGRNGFRSQIVGFKPVQAPRAA